MIQICCVLSVLMFLIWKKEEKKKYDNLCLNVICCCKEWTSVKVIFENITSVLWSFLSFYSFYNSDFKDY